MALTAPTWGGIAAFGLGNANSADLRAWVRVVLGRIDNKRAEFGFNAADGVFEQQLGKGGRIITWQLTVVYKTEAGMKTYEENLEEKIA